VKRNCKSAANFNSDDLAVPRETAELISTDIVTVQ